MLYLLAAAGDMANQAMAKSVEPAGTITTGSLILLCLAIGMALGFEFVNGFHDTANAVATVIYTHSLKPWVAVVWSGCWNLIGVLTSSGGVAFGVLALLPVEMILHVGSSAGFAMVFALLLSAIVWNLGTWYMGLPASSSHSLFGAIIGVGLANAMMSAGHSFGDGVNWAKLKDTLLSLLISPIIGFVFAALLLLLSKAVIKWPELYSAPENGKAPPWPIRGLLILTCTGVSYGHGSNDGQKGMGLVLLILIGILPGVYALDPELSPQKLQGIHTTAVQVQASLARLVPAGAAVPQDPTEVLSAYLKSSGVYGDQTLPALAAINQRIVNGLNGKQQLSDLSPNEKSELRRNIYEASGVLNKLEKSKKLTDPKLTGIFDNDKSGYRIVPNSATLFIPFWVKLATALALGFGTMIGWKRIVVTVGEKIGKTHLSYAQGASAEIVAAVTIQLADHYNLPVSTTHVLSSGVAGTMAANNSGLQMQTLRNLLLAWVLTLPVCTLLGAALFAAGLYVVLHNLVIVSIGLLTLIAFGAGAFFIYQQRARMSGPNQAPAAGGVN
jgi:PiT family inorganic phosphate transporter